jgi:hypothetical protein
MSQFTILVPGTWFRHKLHFCGHKFSPQPKQLGHWINPHDTRCYRWKRVLRRRRWTCTPSGTSASPLLDQKAPAPIPIPAPAAWATDETNLFSLLEHYEATHACVEGEYTSLAVREIEKTKAFAMLYTGLHPLQQGTRGFSMLQRKGSSIRDEWAGLLTDEEAEACLDEMATAQRRQDQVNHFFRALELRLERERNKG